MARIELRAAHTSWRSPGLTPREPDELGGDLGRLELAWVTPEAGRVAR